MNKKETMLQLALMILNDACPPDNRMYLCKMDEAEDEVRCNECWSNYLFWAVNGYLKEHDPYRFERNKHLEGA